jgi:hypothetical protein
MQGLLYCVLKVYFLSKKLLERCIFSLALFNAKQIKYLFSNLIQLRIEIYVQISIHVLVWHCKILHRYISRECNGINILHTYFVNCFCRKHKLIIHKHRDVLPASSIELPWAPDENNLSMLINLPKYQQFQLPFVQNNIVLVWK